MRGFSLFEMLIAIAIGSILMMSIISFYPFFQISLINQFSQKHLEESTHQSVAGLIKDIKRAGFIANKIESIKDLAIEINSSNTCIIIRYDTESTGGWRYLPSDPKQSDIFVYRYLKKNFEMRTGVPNCIGTGWDKLIDQSEIIVNQFSIVDYGGLIQFELVTALKKKPEITYQLKQYVKYEN